MREDDQDTTIIMGEVGGLPGLLERKTPGR